MDNVEVYIVAGKRKRLHRGVRQGGEVLTREADNIDATQQRRVFDTFEEALAQANDSCRRCYPDRVPVVHQLSSTVTAVGGATLNG
jgi:hypothetical protein